MRKLETREISKSYRGRKVVDDVSVSVHQGEVVGLLGPNGAGKTTSFYIVVGLIGADSGRVLLDDNDITGLAMFQRARRGIGRTHQVPRPFGQMTVMENLLVAHLHGARGTGRAARAECERILSLCGLLEFAGTRASDLGLNPSNDGKVVRIPIPSLTEERRKELSRHVHKLTEDGRNSVRQVRRDANERLKKLLKDHQISEDDERKGLDEVQRLTDTFIKHMDEAQKKKDAELLGK